MSTVSPEVQAIADEIKAMAPAAQLRLAADLIEARDAKKFANLAIARSIVDRISGELALVSTAAPTGSVEK